MANLRKYQIKLISTLDIALPEQFNGLPQPIFLVEPGGERDRDRYCRDPKARPSSQPMNLKPAAETSRSGVIGHPEALSHRGEPPADRSDTWPSKSSIGSPGINNRTNRGGAMTRKKTMIRFDGLLPILRK
ncbi:MAG: hypothetical protein WB755_22805 [Terriglobales bacterium]